MSLGGSGTRSLSLSNRDRLVADAEGGVPGNRDRVLHALVRRTALGMEVERTFGRVAPLRGHRQVVMHVNRFDPDRLADPRNAAIDSRLERIAIERALAPCQGATQGAVHSAGDGRNDMVKGRGDRRPFLGAVILAKSPLDSVDNGFGNLPEKGVAITVAVLEPSVRDVLEIVSHGLAPLKRDKFHFVSSTHKTSSPHCRVQ